MGKLENFSIDKTHNQLCIMASIILNVLSTLCLISWNSLSVRLWLTARLLMVLSMLHRQVGTACKRR